MKGLVVYESGYGNTEQIARAMGEALGGVDVVRVTDVRPEQLADLDLLLVGSATRAFRPMPSMATFLSGLAAGSLSGVKVGAFDTRSLMGDNVPGILRFMAKLFGYAAPKIAKRLQAKGGAQGIEPTGFYVLDTEGPLQEGETERAAAWAKKAAGV